VLLRVLLFYGNFMAKELDGLPDLWGILKRLFRRPQKPRAEPPQSSPSAPVQDEAHSSRGWSAAPVDSFTAEPAGVLKPQRTAPLAKVTPSTQTTVKHRLSKRLRNRQSLRQAIVINELLNKPLALRKRFKS